MSIKPIFTVIVPTYNRKVLLKRAIDSILAQTFKQFELIIVDDGSEDNTSELIGTYEDDRIIYIYKENGGLNSARNRALQIAQGEYIAFCDSDDSWLPEKLEKHMQKYLDDKEIKVVYDLTGILETENGKQNLILARNDTCEGWCYEKVLKQGYLTSPTFLSCKRECFDRIGMMPMDLTVCEDDDFCFQLCKHFKVGLVKEILGIYHTDANNRISAMRKQWADDFLYFQEKWSDEVRRTCGREVLCQRYFQAAYNYLEIDEMKKATEIYQRACREKGISVDEVKNKVKNEFFKDDKVIIYGVGDCGKKVFKALKMIGFSSFLFIVTDMGGQSLKELDGIDIKKIGALDIDTNQTIVIASLNYYDEMNAIARERGFIHILSYEKIIHEIFHNL